MINFIRRCHHRRDAQFGRLYEIFKTMLDTTTKKRIDDCRDILVGKLPDPKAQIEQITIGLIYKFMDDMDKEAVELGGRAKFFSDYKIPDPEFPNDRKKDKIIEFSKYAWDQLMHPKVTAAEMLTLYSEAIEGMEKNPNIPQLFRDIFNNAYLPYRDPETLKLFLKTIGEFEYTHSEKLGDAFEYLLSVMGSQGDAGQFRTPRHIIDFLVAIVNPDKTDAILDPACGTAGFLISAYKHILGKYSNGNGIVQTQNSASPQLSPGDQLSPDDRRKLIQNFTGYDISPDMVRLSLVNLYLHGFNTPNIHEYDTLSSEDRWNDTFDVILANPPFMSPKGGIRPHKRFTISSNRSEVLFVDYIAEHLNPNGKAGIIVPEGIIFQSGRAYKDLRKMLVENYLYAVVSLPAGVFNPYSGVKTSILLMDKKIAKQTEEILFIKIDNDGYNLGAQRTPIKGEQLSEAIQIAHYFMETRELEETLIAHLVPKAEIAKNGEYNLSGERYKTQIIINSDFPIVNLKDVAEVISGQSPKSEFYNGMGEGLPFYQGKTEFTEYFIGEPKIWTTSITKDAFKDDILMSVRAPVGPVNFSNQHICIGRGLAAIRVKENIIKEYLFYLLKSQEKNIKGDGGAVFDSISRQQIEALQIPLPPLSVQEEIVAEIEAYQKIIDGAKAVVENYKPHIDIAPDWEMVELGEVCEIKRGRFSHRPRNAPEFYGGRYPFIQTGDVVKSNGGSIPYTQTLNEKGLSVSKLFKPTIVLITIAANIGDTGILDYEACFTDSVVGLIPDKRVNPYYLELIMRTQKKRLNDIAPQAAQKNINVAILKEVVIPIPPLETQRQIVSQIEEEQELVNANKQLIEIFEQKIKDRIAKIWGE